MLAGSDPPAGQPNDAPDRCGLLPPLSAADCATLAAENLAYHEARCHMSLSDNAPEPRRVEPPEKGKVISVPMVSGLHHRYTRAA